MSTRVCLSFNESPSGFSSRKVWFLFDKSSCRIVADLEYLIRKKFDINSLCNLHLDGFLLPSREKIDLVRDGDNLMVEKLPDGIVKARPLVKYYASEDSQGDQPLTKKKKFKHNKIEREDIYSSKQWKKKEKQTLKDKKLAKVSNNAQPVRASHSSQGMSTRDLHSEQRNNTTKKKSSKSTLLTSRGENKTQKSLSKQCNSKASSKTMKQKGRKKSTTFKKNVSLPSSSSASKDSNPKKTVIPSRLESPEKSSSSEESSSEQSSTAEESINEEDHMRNKKATPSNVKHVGASALSTLSSTKNSHNPKPHGTTHPEKLLNSGTARSVSLLQCTSEEPSRDTVGMPNQNGIRNHIHFDSDEDESSVSHQHLNASGNRDISDPVDSGLNGHDKDNAQTPHINNNVLTLTTLTNGQPANGAEYPDVSKSNNGTIKLPTNQEQSQRKDPVDYTKLAPLLGPPRPGDRIAYKILELSASYTPEMSDYKEGLVLTYNPATNEVFVELNEESLVKPRGDGNVSNKFELISGDEDEEDPIQLPLVLERKVAVCLSSMVDPKLISP